MYYLLYMQYYMAEALIGDNKTSIFGLINCYTLANMAVLLLIYMFIFPSLSIHLSLSLSVVYLSICLSLPPHQFLADLLVHEIYEMMK